VWGVALAKASGNGATSSRSSSARNATAGRMSGRTSGGATRANGLAMTSATATAGNVQRSGLGIKQQQKSRVPNNTPLSSSVQEHFRGFTYQGESNMEEMFGQVCGGEDEPDVVDLSRDPRAALDDDWEDEEPGGRYRDRQRSFE